MGVRKIVQNISESTGARRKAEFWPPAPSKAWWYKNCNGKHRAKGYAWRAWLHCKQIVSFTICLCYHVCVVGALCSTHKG